MLIDLTQMICVIIVFAYVITRTKMFQEVLDNLFSWKNQLFLALAFGLMSIYGTYSGIDFMGAQSNVRDLGPMIGGLVGGPVVGIGAGLIGGLHRLLFIPGPTTLPCSIATMCAGALGGAIYLLAGRKFAGVTVAVAFAVFQESFHMGLTLLLVSPYSVAVAIVANVGPPMILVNALGMLIFAFLVNNLLNERQTAAERDRLHAVVERERLEMEIAQDIQRNFLPEAAPSASGFDVYAINVPAKEVGGDFYDYIDLGDGRHALVIADVSGKGVPGAIYMALTCTVLRAASRSADGPAQAVAEANRIIAERSASGMFVTLFLAAIEPRTRTLTYVNAGHNPPLLLRGGSFIELSSDGVALGVLDDIQPKEETVVLERGDILLLYTDGVTEATGPLDQQYGEERLRAALLDHRNATAADMVGSIRADVLAFSRGEAQFDDITLMVVKVMA